MTPHEVLLCIKGFEQKQHRYTEYQNTMMYIQGRYFVDALLCTVGNMFSAKGAQKIEYPKKPYDIEPPKEETELTDKEKEEQVRQFFDGLMLMKANFELEKNKSGGN